MKELSYTTNIVVVFYDAFVTFKWNKFNKQDDDFVLLLKISNVCLYQFKYQFDTKKKIIISAIY